MFTADRQQLRPGTAWWPIAAAVLLGVVLVTVLVVTAGASPYTELGNGDPGFLVRLVTPLARLAADLAATLCVGSLVFAAGFVAPREDGQLSASGYAAVRLACWSGLAWLVAALVLVPFDVADTVGEPLSAVAAPGHLFGLLGALEEPRAWLVTAIVVLVVVAGAWSALRWATTVWLVALAVFALLPPLVTGHASSDAGHDLATTALLLHVPAAVVWLGTLVAVVAHVARTGGGDVALGRRYARVATWCWAIVLTTGVVDALVLVPVGQLTHSTYGVLVLVEFAVAVVLGWLGSRWRRGALAGGSIGRLVVAELVLLVAAFGMAVAQAHLAPPSFLARPATGQETLLGYALAGPPTPLRLLTDWRIDILFGPLAVLLAVGYLLAVRRASGPWPVARTVSWLAGCLLVLVATSSGIGRYAPAMFSMHMLSHMLLSMAAPVLLVLGAPLTLLDAVLPADAVSRRLFGSPVVRALTHPVVALVLFAGSPFALYLTGLFDAAARFHWAHTAIGVWFFVVGLLFAWVVVGVDPTPRRLPNLARLGMLLAAMPSDTVFAAIVLTTHRVIGNGDAGDNQYQALALPWVHGLLSDQHAAGIVALAITEVTLLAVVVILLLRWSAAEDDDAEQALIAGFS
ncbi:MAG TPA: cytochrome c oxidase assembly protein [Pseudonocardiaceae bacterium]|nr:cytochrome c oxidase assembly protein [Pseudonocardiaceae bacterium]